jgi:aspartyl-tRNA(Asn)/glutamyl-tRNA(Gln) amidotransferase subunit B
LNPGVGEPFSVKIPADELTVTTNLQRQDVHKFRFIQLIVNWINGEVAARLNREEKSIADCPLSAERLAGLVARVADNTLSNKLAKQVFEALWDSELSADAVIERDGLKQVSDVGAIEKLVEEALAANPKAVEEFRAGKEKALNALAGQVMKASKGKANPAQVQDILRQKLTA